MATSIAYLERSRNELRYSTISKQQPEQQPLSPTLIGGGGGIRARAATVGEAFRKLGQMHRRRSGSNTAESGGNKSAGSPSSAGRGGGSSLSGSMMALYAPGGGAGRPLNHDAVINLVVLGEKESHQAGLSVGLHDAWQRTHPRSANNEHDSVGEDYISFRDYSGIRRLRFIPIDSEKDDLWDSIECSGYVVVYKTAKSASLRKALQTIGFVRSLHNTLVVDRPIWLVGIGATNPVEKASSSNADANQVKQLVKSAALSAHLIVSGTISREVTELTEEQLAALSRVNSQIVGRFSVDKAAAAVNPVLQRHLERIHINLDEPARRKRSRSCDDLTHLLNTPATARALLGRK